MTGIIAAGSTDTAEAGLHVLRAGGNAVDALVAALLATPIAEPGLSSLGGGGAMQFLAAGAAAPSVCEFFANGPGLAGATNVDKDFFHVDLSFGPALQRFHMGRASAAVPGFIPGVMAAHEKWGELPLSEVVAPAARLARAGVALSAYQAFACSFHQPMLTHTPELRRIFAPSGHLVGEGERVCNPALGDTLEALGRSDWRRFYQGEIVPAILRDFGEGNGGIITSEDLRAYQPARRQPLKVTYRDVEIYLNPPPAGGGILVALALHLLADLDFAGIEWGSESHLRDLIDAMRVVEESRTVDGSPLEDIGRWRRRFTEVRGGRTPTTPAAKSAGHTTHVSVIDARGNAAAATVSYGQGAGTLIGETGIPMNNLMGEADLFPHGFFTLPAGQRLATNMSPSVVRWPDGRVAVLGSGGSNRIRTAILQVITNLIDFQLPAAEAVGRSRVHWEGGVLNAEIYDRPDATPLLTTLLEGDDTLLPFDAPNMFFGGVHLAESVDGGTSGAGDPRRSGVALTA